MATLAKLGKWLLVAVCTLVALFPFYWMLRTAVAPLDEISFQGISLFPSRIDFSGFTRAWEVGGWGAPRWSASS